MKPEKRWTVLDLIDTTAEYFTEKNIENPRLNAEQLLGHTLNLSRVQLYVSFERPLTEDELIEFREKVKRRARREPLQHIIGETEFMGFPFIVNRDVLIPRPETEILVEEIIKLKPEIVSKNPVILDIGTGSGCIAISLAKLWPEAKIIALDQSEPALQIANKNCKLNLIESFTLENGKTHWNLIPGSINLLQQDILSGFTNSGVQMIDIVVSNPPYISKVEMNDLQPEVKDYEPWQALTDNSDGLLFYKQILQLTSGHRELNCKYLCLEMSGSQSDKIIALAKEYSFSAIDIINDLNRIPRVLKIKVV